jgi:hypothetical protein
MAAAFFHDMDNGASLVLSPDPRSSVPFAASPTSPAQTYFRPYTFLIPLSQSDEEEEQRNRSNKQRKVEGGEQPTIAETTTAQVSGSMFGSIAFDDFQMIFFK